MQNNENNNNNNENNNNNNEDNNNNNEDEDNSIHGKVYNRLYKYYKKR